MQYSSNKLIGQPTILGLRTCDWDFRNQELADLESQLAESLRPADLAPGGSGHVSRWTATDGEVEKTKREKGDQGRDQALEVDAAAMN